jgi:arginase family enzyme
MQIIKVPTSLGGLSAAKGAELAPDKVEAKLKEFWLSESGKLPVFAIDEVKLAKSDISATAKAIFEAVKKAKENFAVVGGDHFISNPSFKAFASNFKSQGKEPGIIVFDAHPDLMPEMKGSLTHEDWLRELISSEVLKPENVVIVGARATDKEEANFIRERSIKNYPMTEIAAEGIHAVCDSVMAAAKDFGALYISVDIDVVDPAFAPGTGYIEPGGLTSRELIYFLQRLKLLKNFKAMDVVEVNPPKDANEMTSKLAAKILVEMC